ncbi:hypothetical protein [Thermoflexus sp.]|uniref:hypothetical protein n=1 Tax=Thermoflexus sp. TaxID=1969742 RepID=UPI0025D44D41|nr:hypothetical protein [Thermoflexus sp.]MDW8179835.1 hypothetical protein [Anaerolineae bacterium]MCS6963442.1 hypothetical protein [Thermoflexus sp.]MCS7350384.1 hypothetical protein [Thermoflexus sp.]MCX7689930.1 hypothetical protein [Thermoflexus sp.]MDW8184183.1 hypothetical protein [Anaerolineae bacterium]
MDRLARVWLLLIQIVLGYEWLSSGLRKLETGGQFVAGLPQTLARFAEKNPYPWMKAFLTGPATANATLFGNLVPWGEVLAGLGLIAGALYLLFLAHRLNGVLRRVAGILVAIALLGGMTMNAIFGLAAGHTSPSTAGLNLVMFFSQAMLLGFWIGVILQPVEEIALRRRPA